ncbi:MAG: glycine--tRNA ligase subunit beta [Betaproteobacteria bacterium]|nr:glycine--tRNA ligase subunit beta [Betaproteobacteria bacterium]
MSANLLVELFTEELPPRALRDLAERFGQHLQECLVRLKLKEAGSSDLRVFATPRRLAALIGDVHPRAADRTESKKLMPAKVAFGAEGKPSAALGKRLEKEGATAGELERRLEGGIEYVYLKQMKPGVTLAAGLQLALQEAIEKLPIPKLMSYQLADGVTSVRFVRPAHGLVVIHGTQIVDVSVLGLKAGRVTHGHRFQGVKDIELASADAYESSLAAHGMVIASFDERRAEIETQLCTRAAEMGASLGPEEPVALLLDEVTALVEYPSVYAGQFESEFLSAPQECLVLTMRTNQKYFPLFDFAGKLSNRFLIVSNMRLADPKNIVEGNQRVVRPRLADARFFFDSDCKARLESRVPQLSKVVYHNKLGTQLERTGRVQLLAGQIARAIGADPLLAERAAWLAKADLLTHMVGEFPELQGIMGRYYATGDGEDARVAAAIEQHYLPRFAGDTLPQESIALALALADKLETLAGMFGIGQQPSGDKDPYALRRHALGVIRMLVEGSIDVSLFDLVDLAFSAFPKGILGGAQADLRMFILERMRGYLREMAYTTNEIESVLCMNPMHLASVPRQLAAVRAFASLPEAASLAAANKRVANILKQAQAKGESFANASVAAMTEDAEIKLHDALAAASRIATPLFKNGDYTGYLKAFAVLKAPVDAFFDSIMVMVDDPVARRSRLALLCDLRDQMNRVADISKLAA